MGLGDQTSLVSSLIPRLPRLFEWDGYWPDAEPEAN